jgi:hypothetical protein
MKRHKLSELPSAEDAMIPVVPPAKEDLVEREHESTAVREHRGAKAPLAKRLHISTYVSPEVFKRVEEVRFKMRVEHGRKNLKKSDVVERALKIGLEDISKLLEL